MYFRNVQKKKIPKEPKLWKHELAKEHKSCEVCNECKFCKDMFLRKSKELLVQDQMKTKLVIARLAEYLMWSLLLNKDIIEEEKCTIISGAIGTVSNFRGKKIQNISDNEK